MSSMKMMVVPMVMIGINQAGVDLTDETTIHYVRIMFATAQTVIFLSYSFVYLKVNFSKSDIVKMVTVETKEPFGPDAGKTKTEELTYAQYDNKQLRTLFSQLLIGLLITGWTHNKWGYVQPLLFQAILQPINLFTHAIFRIHVLGQSDQEEDLKRPWKEEKPGAMFEDLKKQLDPDSAEKEEKKEQRKLKGASNKAAVKSGKNGK